jgi:DNA-binding ferritin-like protein
MEKCEKTANLFLATLKSIYHTHQFNHWHSSGANFYSSHLLFQRLYESTLEQIDSCAEKFIGVLGEHSVDLSLQAQLVCNIILKYKDKKGFEQSLEIEKDFQKLITETKKCFIDECKMTEGLLDMLAGLANEHETNIYLLSRSLK